MNEPVLSWPKNIFARFGYRLPVTAREETRSDETFGAILRVYNRMRNLRRFTYAVAACVVSLILLTLYIQKEGCYR